MHETQNTKNILVRAKLEPSTTEPDAIITHNTSSLQLTPSYKPKKIAVPQPTKCGKKRCATCPHYNANNYFCSTATKQRFRTRHPFSCNSKNAIYLITCSKCKKKYVRLTTQPLRERINRH